MTTAADGVLRIVRSGRQESLRLDIPIGKPLGAAIVLDGEMRGVAGYLRVARSTGVGDRYVMPADEASLDAVRSVLCDYATLRLVGEPTWIEVPCTSGQNGLVGLLLSREQRHAVARLSTVPTVALSVVNGQLIDPAVLDRPYRQIPLQWAETSGGSVPDGIETFQTIDSSPFSEVLDNPHSYYVILGTASAPAHRTGWVKVTNPIGLDAGVDLATSFAVRTAFSNDIAFNNVAVDETVSVAVGLREGEVVHIASIDPHVGSLRRRAFSFRHSVVRVIGATTMDMEKPIVRLPAGVLDILGVSSGSRIVVEALSRSDNRIRCVSVRAMEEREQREARIGGLLDVLDVTGSVDLPAIAMDLSMRMKLGVRRGDPVYVRPEFGTVLFEELTAISFALLAAAFGAFAANAQFVAVTLVLVYVALSAASIWRRFR